MRGHTHLMSGFILGTALCAKADLSPTLLVSCMIGSIFADTDHRKSMLGRIIPLWLIFRPHRKNVLHSLRGLAVVSLLWGLMLMSVLHAVFFAAGYLAHLALDSLTKMGIPWLWPNKRMFSIAGVVGGVMELLMLFVFYTIVVGTISFL